MTFECNRRNTPGCTNDCVICPVRNRCKYCLHRNVLCDRKETDDCDRALEDRHDCDG